MKLWPSTVGPVTATKTLSRFAAVVAQAVASPGAPEMMRGW